MNNIEAKCDFCDKAAVHFCGHAISQSCEEHIKRADQIEDQYWDYLSKFEEERRSKL